jgi:hypothetical protein
MCLGKGNRGTVHFVPSAMVISISGVPFSDLKREIRNGRSTRGLVGSSYHFRVDVDKLFSTWILVCERH